MNETNTLWILFLLGLIVFLIWRLRVLSRRLKELTFSKKSGEVLHGKSWEQFAPFMEHYPYDPENFRFIGTPIDGISFEDDKVVFVEFKTGQSRLSGVQRRIKEHVEAGQVEWKELRG